MRVLPALLGLAALCACTTASEPGARLEASEQADEAPVVEGAVVEGAVAEGDVFGAALDDGLELTELADIAADPEAYRDRVVRTEGEIARVCQRAGCWMELRQPEGPGVRVPMAGHAFLLPRDAAGRHATLQGRVQVQELSADVREHLASEGALATASSLAIHATGVVIN